jgi:hypothetical protein
MKLYYYKYFNTRGSPGNRNMAYSSLVLAVKKCPMFGECQFVWSNRWLQFKRTHDTINYLPCTCDIRTIFSKRCYLPITYMIHVPGPMTSRPYFYSPGFLWCWSIYNSKANIPSSVSCFKWVRVRVLTMVRTHSASVTIVPLLTWME